MTTKADTSVADAIRAMQNRLGRPEWWCRERYLDGDAACLIGAMHVVFGPGNVRDGVMDVLVDAARGWTSNPATSLPGLNDGHLKDHDELLLFLDAALDVAEAEGL